MSAMTSGLSGGLAVTGQTNGVSLTDANDYGEIVLSTTSPPNGPDTTGRLTFRGTFTGASIQLTKYYTSSDTGSLLQGAIRLDTLAQITTTFSLTNSTALDVDLGSIAGLYKVRATLTAIGSGTVVAEGVTVASGNAGGGGSGVVLPVPVSVTAIAQTITSSSANALAVGPNGTTNPTFNVDASTASAATGFNVKSAAAAGGLAVSVVSSGTNENLTIDAKGSGTITMNATGTGNIVSSRLHSFSLGQTFTGTTGNNPLSMTDNLADALNIKEGSNSYIKFTTTNGAEAITFGKNPRIPTATVAAGGTAQANANAVTEGFTLVTGANNAAAIVLPSAVAGMVVTVKSGTSGSVLKVFPAASDAINGAAANAVYNMANLSQRTFTAYDATTWYTDEETPT